jgi:hypothetical protein
MARKKKSDNLVSEQDLVDELEKLTLEYENMAIVKRKSVSTIQDKLTKINESFTIYMYDNGYMIEVSGRDSENDYKTAKIMVTNLEQLVALVQEATEMERDE